MCLIWSILGHAIHNWSALKLYIYWVCLLLSSLNCMDASEELGTILSGTCKWIGVSGNEASKLVCIRTWDLLCKLAESSQLCFRNASTFPGNISLGPMVVTPLLSERWQSQTVNADERLTWSPFQSLLRGFVISSSLFLYHSFCYSQAFMHVMFQAL